MDFREGGQWLYSMRGPNGEEAWSKASYKSINNLKSFESVDTFCDENGIDNNEFPILYWHSTFKTIENKTIVNIEIKFDTSSELNEIIEMGFKEGFTDALDNLEEYLKNNSSG